MTPAETIKALYDRMLAERGPDDPDVKALKLQVDAETKAAEVDYRDLPREPVDRWTVT